MPTLQASLRDRPQTRSRTKTQNEERRTHLEGSRSGILGEDLIVTQTRPYTRSQARKATQSKTLQSGQKEALRPGGKGPTLPRVEQKVSGPQVNTPGSKKQAKPSQIISESRSRPPVTQGKQTRSTNPSSKTKAASRLPGKDEAVPEASPRAPGEPVGAAVGQQQRRSKPVVHKNNQKAGLKKDGRRGVAGGRKQEQPPPREPSTQAKESKVRSSSRIGAVQIAGKGRL